MKTEYIGMPVKDYVRDWNRFEGVIPARIIIYLRKNWMLSDPLDEKSIEKLEFLNQIWRKQVILQSMMAGFSIKRRKKFVENSDFEERWERHAYALFKKRSISPTVNKHLTLPRVADEVEAYLEITLHPAQYAKLRKIKKKADDAVRYARKHGKILPAEK